MSDAEYYRWRPIDQIHEDYGDCVLINLRSDSGIELGNVCDFDFDISKWTHFAPVPRLTHEDVARLLAEMGEV